MKSLTSKTLPYRKCEFVYRRLLEWGREEISRYDLLQLVRKYCAASPKTVDEYEKRFLEYGFLRNHPRKPNTFQVDQKNIFFPADEQERNTSSPNTAKEKLFHNIREISNSDVSCSNSKLDEIIQQSKTVVYPVAGEKKVTLSFKGYKSLWQPFKEAVWADGFPDICYVLHIFISAFLNANRDKIGRIDIPSTIRDMNFYITIKAPYIVKRPRRKITYRKEEIIEEDE